MENLDIRRFLKILLNTKLCATLIIILFIGIGYFYSFYYVKPMYKSSATVVLVQNDISVSSKGNTITQTDIALNQNLLSTYTKIVKSNKVLTQVIQNLNLDMSEQELSDKIEVSAINNTEILKISVSNLDSNLAATITNKLIEVFSNEIKSLYNIDNVYTMDKAEISTQPFNINHKRDLIIFGILGCVVTLGIVMIKYLFDTTIKTEEDIEKYAQMSILSSIPIYNNVKKANELITNEQPKSIIAESFKTFRTNVMFSKKNESINTILVTSGNMGEGKSFVSANLAVTFAQAGKKVILIDTDMRKGRQHKIFNILNRHGLSDCLSDLSLNNEKVNINKYTKKTNISNLYIMTSGTIPPNPSELVSSKYMRALLKALNNQYDVVICDGSPCMLVSDSIILSKMVDTTVLVVANRITKIDNLIKVKKSIEMVAGNISGAIINKVVVNKEECYCNLTTTSNLNMKIENYEDNLLENELTIKGIEIEDIEEDIVNVEQREEKFNLQDLNHSFSNNVREVKSEMSQIKMMYKDLSQNALNTLLKKDNTQDVIIEELNDIKELYKSNIVIQNKQVEELNKQIQDVENSENINKEQLIEELNKQIQNVENNENINKEQLIEELNKQIQNIENNENTNKEQLIEELNNIKKLYNLNVKGQNEKIDVINKKILKLTEDENYNAEDILVELNNIKDLCNYNTDIQNDQIQKLNEDILDLQDIGDDNTDTLLKELNNIKNLYNININEQNNQIEAIDIKLSSLKCEYNDSSDKLITELESFKQFYEDRNDIQDEKIEELIDKVIEIEDNEISNSDNLINELNNLKQIYSEDMEEQKQQISKLHNKVSNIEKEETSSVLLKEILAINKQLEVISNRFDNLEKQANHNEHLINLVIKDNENELLRNRKNKTIDVKKLNEKVIKLQDYIEEEYIQDKDIIEQQVKKIDKDIEIIEEIKQEQIQDKVKKEDTITLEKQEIIKQQPKQLYDTVQEIEIPKVRLEKQETTIEDKSRKGFGIFKNKKSSDQVEIVSQILYSNKFENVG